MNFPDGWLSEQRFNDAIGPNAARHRRRMERLLLRAGGDPVVAARLPSWSWYGLLLGTGYLYYRKLWWPASILLTIEIAASILPTPFSYIVWTAAALVMALWAEAWVLGRTHRLISNNHFSPDALRTVGGVSVPVAIGAVVLGSCIAALVPRVLGML